MPRAVLFDAAGTLIELVESVGETYGRIAATHGVALPAWRLDDAFARVHARAEPMCFPTTPHSEIPERERAWWRDVVRQTFLAADSTARFADFDAFFETLWQHFTAARSWRLRDGTAAVLRALRASGCSTAVVSNFDHRLLDLLKELEINQEFSCVVIPFTHGLAKPDPRIFAAALEALAVSAGDAVYVGDQPEIDGATARAAGLQFVDVRELASLDELSALLG